MVVSLGYGIKGGEQTPYSYSYNGGQDWVEGIVEENDQIVFPLDAFANEQELDLMFRFCVVIILVEQSRCLKGMIMYKPDIELEEQQTLALEK